MVHSPRIVLSAGQAGNLESGMSLCCHERNVVKKSRTPGQEKVNFISIAAHGAWVTWKGENTEEPCADLLSWLANLAVGVPFKVLKCESVFLRFSAETKFNPCPGSALANKDFWLWSLKDSKKRDLDNIKHTGVITGDICWENTK